MIHNALEGVLLAKHPFLFTKLEELEHCQNVGLNIAYKYLNKYIRCPCLVVGKMLLPSREASFYMSSHYNFAYN